MKSLTKYLAGLIVVAGALAQVPGVQKVLGGLIAGHPNLAAILAAISALLALFHSPSKAS